MSQPTKDTSPGKKGLSALPFELLLALRYLRPKRTFVSFITLISILGVMLGVTVLIVVIAVMSGFDQEWQERILGFNADVRIVRYDNSPMFDAEGVQELVRQSPLVTGASPYILDQVMVETHPKYGDSDIRAPLIRGIAPETEGQVSVLPDSIVDGEYDLDDYGVIIGTSFAFEMGLRVGDTVAIYSRKDLQTMREKQKSDDEVAILPEDYEVRGIFDVRFADYNSSIIFTSLEQAQEMNGWENGEVKGILVNLSDPMKAPYFEEEMSRMLGPEFRIFTWQEDYADIFEALVVEKNMILFLLFFIVVVAAFGITSSLITFVVQKTREIGVLRALGANRIQVMSLFIGQSIVVGIMGVSIGLVLGLTALHYRNEFLQAMVKLTGKSLLDPAIYKLYDLPSKILPSDLAVICGVSLLICILAGVIPAWIAGNLRPVEALRHE